MGDSERRDLLLARQQELRVRHDGLTGLDAEALHRTERLDPVLFDTDELMKVVDDIAAETAHRLLLATFVLLCVAAGPAVLVAVGLLPAPALLGSLLLLAAAAALWVASRATARTGS